MGNTNRGEKRSGRKRIIQFETEQFNEGRHKSGDKKGMIKKYQESTGCVNLKIRIYILIVTYYSEYFSGKKMINVPIYVQQ